MSPLMCLVKKKIGYIKQGDQIGIGLRRKNLVLFGHIKYGPV
jgi:hypothetical protein